jgi:hypothetical protein
VLRRSAVEGERLLGEKRAASKGLSALLAQALADGHVQ